MIAEWKGVPSAVENSLSRNDRIVGGAGQRVLVEVEFSRDRHKRDVLRLQLQIVVGAAALLHEAHHRQHFEFSDVHMLLHTLALEESY